MPDPVQPAEGQGGDGGGPPYAEYLDSVPEQFREQVEPAFKKWDADTSKKFQEHAEYRKQWSPYEELGVNNYDPEELGQVLSVAGNPSEYLQWVSQQDPDLARKTWEEFGNSNEWFESDEQSPELDPQQIAQSFESKLEERLSPLEQTLQQQAEERRAEEAQSHVDGIFSELKQEHGDAFNEEIEQATRAFARAHFENGVEDVKEAITKGYQDVQALQAKAESGIVSDKLSAPEPPNQGGSPDSAAKPITSFEEAAQAAKERMAG